MPKHDFYIVILFSLLCACDQSIKNPDLDMNTMADNYRDATYIESIEIDIDAKVNQNLDRDIQSSTDLSFVADQAFDPCTIDNGNCGDPSYFTCTNNEGADPTCADIDECLVNNGDCGDPSYFTCTNNEGADPTCTDIDECLVNNGECGEPVYFSCTNNEGSDPTCADIDECLVNNGDCGDPSYFTCTNNEGADPTCADIDECLVNNGDCGDPSYFTCTNNEGADPTCADIDECLVNNGNCGDSVYFSCTNNEGADPSCADIDECLVNNGECGDLAYVTCSNNEGANPTCVDIDECLVNNGECGDPTYFICTNNEGADPSCTDIDECLVNNGDCGDPSYFTCANNEGADPTCADIDECLVNNGNCGDSVYFSCTNNEGADPSCADIDECLVNNGECGDLAYVACSNNEGADPTCVDIDECLVNNGECGDSVYFSCTNNEGVDPSCTDIDECLVNNGECGDPTYFICTNNEGADPTCTDIDECLVNNGDCGDPSYFTCANNEGADPTCADIDECLVNNGNCGDSVYFSCTNNEGADPSCADIDECLVNNGECGDLAYVACSNNEGADPTCVDIDECLVNNGECGDSVYFSCTNNEGVDPSCTDIDECLVNNGECGDLAYVTCSNNEGAGPTCVDINECLVNNGECGDPTYFICTNNEGADPTCTDIDECATDNGECGNPEYFSCTNNEGADPTCADIDECLVNNGDCGDLAYVTCTNNEGVDPTCTDIDECLVNNGDCGDPVYFTCTNNEGANPTCTDIDECATDNGECGNPEHFRCQNQIAAPPLCDSLDLNWDGDAGDQIFATAANWDPDRTPTSQSYLYIGPGNQVNTSQAVCARLLIDVGSILTQSTNALRCPMDIRGAYHTAGGGINPAGRQIELRGSLGPQIPWIDTWSTSFIFWDGALFENTNMQFRLRQGNSMTFHLSSDGFTPLHARSILEPQTWRDVAFTIDISRYNISLGDEVTLLEFDNADASFREAMTLDAIWERGDLRMDGKLWWDHENLELKVTLDSSIPPNDLSVILTPEDPTSSNQLIVTAQTSHRTAILAYRWWVNDVERPEQGAELSGDLASGDQVRVEVSAVTSEGASEAVIIEVEVLNSPPQLSDLNITPTSPSSTDTLEVSWLVNDSDPNDPEPTVSCAWETYRNGAWLEFQAPSVNSSFNCNGLCAPNEVIRARCQASDGIDTGAPVYSLSELIYDPACSPELPECSHSEYGLPPVVSNFDYSYWYWPTNHSSTRRSMHFLSAYYGLIVNEDNASLNTFGILNDPLPMTEASQLENDVVANLPSATLTLGASASDLELTMTDSLRAGDRGSDVARMIDGGRYMNNIELPVLIYNGDESARGRLGIAAMPRHVSLTHSIERDAGVDEIHMILGGDAISTLSEVEEVIPGRALKLTDESGDGWLFIVYDKPDSNTQLTLENGVLTATRTVDEADTKLSVSLTAIPTLGLNEANLAMYLDPSRVHVRYTPLDTLGIPVNEALDILWDETLGSYRVDLWTRTHTGFEGDVNFETRPTIHNWYGRHHIELDSGSLHDLSLPLAFHSGTWVSLNVTGGAAILRDPSGEPLGIPVQISKNWHDGANNFYHFYAQPILRGGSTREMELTIASSRWGADAYAASHAQLSLIGYYSAGGHWDESALGCFGESITYDPDVTLGRAMVDDVRPFLVQTTNRWTWTGNVGGADFLRYTQADSPQTLRRLSRVRSVYHEYGPNLTEVTYAGISTDGKILGEITSQLGRTDDMVRNYYHFDYTFLEDVEYGRFALFQVAADRYADNRYTRYAYRDEFGLIVDQPVNTVRATGYVDVDDRGVKLFNDSPWVTLYHNTKDNGNLPELYADLGFVVRDYYAEIGDAVLTTPYINISRTLNGDIPQTSFELGIPHEEGSPWCGAPCQGLTRMIPAGSRIRATVEYLVIPADKSRYYGTNNHLNDFPAEQYRSNAMMQHLAEGNHYEVTMHTGSLERLYPISIVANSGVLAAEFTIEGGLGYLAMSFTSLSRYDGWHLERLNGASWERVDQSVIGADYWQSRYRPNVNGYTLTFNVKGEATQQRYRLRWVQN